jgi:hypothetical protein
MEVSQMYNTVVASGDVEPKVRKANKNTDVVLADGEADRSTLDHNADVTLEDVEGEGSDENDGNTFFLHLC